MTHEDLFKWIIDQPEDIQVMVILPRLTALIQTVYNDVKVKGIYFDDLTIAQTKSGYVDATHRLNASAIQDKLYKVIHEKYTVETANQPKQ